ncbi:MAG: histidinol-phosphatase HisJ family protein [Candidatus Sumerlaeia bacterium]|nr:histidinol-phosphatase HisJ family protein [Candidatus Sumerlaeia bacterium]
MIDLHNHTPLCHHAVGEPEEYLARARTLGLREYGFSEHSPWMLQYDGEQIAPTDAEFDQYLDRMQALRERHDGTDGPVLRIGIEMDFRPEHAARARAMAAAFPFDHHIGSVHNLGDWIFDHPDRLHEWAGRDVGQVYREYFAAIRAMLDWNLIDIVGHLDLPKKFGHLPPEGIESFVEELLPDLVAAGVAVEINTAGRDKPVGEFYPGPAVVARLARAGVPFTLGSDAHKPSEVGRHIGDALELLRGCGVREVMTFSQRQRVGVRI